MNKKSNSNLHKWLLAPALAVSLLSAHNLMAQAGGPPPGGPGGAPPAAGAATDSPLVDSIAFSGNTKLSAAALSKDAKLKVGDKLSRENMKAEIERIVALYRKSGYNLSISPDIQHPADGHVTITFKIDENGTAGDAGAAPGGGGGGPPMGAPPAGK